MWHQTYWIKVSEPILTYGTKRIEQKYQNPCLHVAQNVLNRSIRTHTYRWHQTLTLGPSDCSILNRSCFHSACSRTERKNIYQINIKWIMKLHKSYISPNYHLTQSICLSQDVLLPNSFSCQSWTTYCVNLIITDFVVLYSKLICWHWNKVSCNVSITVNFAVRPVSNATELNRKNYQFQINKNIWHFLTKRCVAYCDEPRLCLP